MDHIREEFNTRVDIKDAVSLRRFFNRYAFFSTNDLAMILGLCPSTIRIHKRYAGIKRANASHNKPENPSIHTHIDLPEDWDTPEWWRANYPRYGTYILRRATGLSYRTVRRRIQKHCGPLRSHREAAGSMHPCYTKEWLQEYYVDQGLSQKRCGAIAGVSDSTIRDWLVHLGFQVRSRYGSSPLDQVSRVRVS